MVVMYMGQGCGRGAFKSNAFSSNSAPMPLHRSHARVGIGFMQYNIYIGTRLIYWYCQHIFSCHMYKHRPSAQHMIQRLQGQLNLISQSNSTTFVPFVLLTMLTK